MTSGDNLVRCGPGHYFSSCYANGEYGDGGEDTAWRGADGNLNTQWSSLERHNSYWQASFQRPTVLEQVSIWGRGGGDTISGRLEFSDGSSHEFGGFESNGCRKTVSFPSRVTTFVRFKVTGMGNRNTTGFREIEAHSYKRYPDGGDPSCNAPGQPGGGSQPTFAIGALVGLPKGTDIRTGPGFSYPKTIPQDPWGGVVPEDNWMVVIKGGPVCADGWEWWDVDRKAAGDPHGGTGWAAIKTPCSTTSTPPVGPDPQPTAPPRPGAACLGAGIEAKWRQHPFLGQPTICETTARTSPSGTTGVYAAFEWGHIHWSSRYGAFETHGAIDGLHIELGGSGSWLGFPTSDEYDWNNGRRSNFETGYIFWDKSRACARTYGAPAANSCSDATGRVTLERVWTSDGGLDLSPKSVFRPGEAIGYSVRLNNQTGGDADVTMSWHVFGAGVELASYTGTISVHAGQGTYNLPNSLPDDLLSEAYHFTFSLYSPTVALMSTDFKVRRPPPSNCPMPGCIPMENGSNARVYPYYAAERQYCGGAGQTDIDWIVLYELRGEEWDSVIGNPAERHRLRIYTDDWTVRTGYELAHLRGQPLGSGVHGFEGRFLSICVGKGRAGSSSEAQSVWVWLQP